MTLDIRQALCVGSVALLCGAVVLSEADNW
jgi:hypothetical protein